MASIQVVGLHGVGKTTVVRAAAHRLRKRRPEQNVAYVDCRALPAGSLGSVKSRDGLVRDIASQTGGLQGLDVTGREAALLARLRRGEWILILDGYEATTGGDADEFVSRIGSVGDTCVVLVTTRALSWPSKRISVGRLSVRGLRRIIRNESRLSGSQASRIASESRGLPSLAIRGANRVDSGVPVSVTVTDLRIETATYYERELMRAANTTESADVLYLVAISDAPISLTSVHQVLGLSAGEAADALHDLQLDGLVRVEPSGTARHYVIPDELVAALDGWLPRQGVIDRLVSWTQAVVPAEIGYAWSRTDLAGVADVTWAFTTLLRLDEVVLRGGCGDIDQYGALAARLSGWLFANGYWVELHKLADLLASSSWRASAGDLIRLNLLWDLKARVKTGDRVGALASVGRTVSFLPGLPAGEARLLSAALQTCGLQLRHFGAADAAVSMALSSSASAAAFHGVADVGAAEAALLHLGESELLSMSLVRRGNVASEESDYVLAERLYRDSLAVAVSAGSAPWAREAAAVAEGNLGVLFNRQANWAGARTALQRAAPELSQLSEQVVALAELALAYEQEGENAPAIEEWSRASELATRLGMPRAQCESSPHWLGP